MFLNAKFVKQLNISVKEIDDQMLRPLLQTSQGPTAQTLLSNM